MLQFNNPFVSYLNRYTTVTSEHESAFDEFVAQSLPPSGDVLRLKTKTEEFVFNHFQREFPASIILTGNAGDGKTYLCRQIVRAFTGKPLDNWGDEPELNVQKDGKILRIIKDLSEIEIDRGVKVLKDLLLSIHEQSNKVIFLIAANEGRLRDLLVKGDLNDIHQAIDKQLTQGTEINNKSIIVLNLNEVTTSTYVVPTLQWMTDTVHWQACEGCSAFSDCPIRFNAGKLRDQHVGKRLQLLYQILEHIDIHVTMRDMLIHLSYTLTSGQTCQEIINRNSHPGKDFHKDVYYENVFGSKMKGSFQHFAVINHLRRFEVGAHSRFEIDDYIINGHHSNLASSQKYEQLFAPDVDLEKSRFEIDRDAYLQGGTSSPQHDANYPFIEGWLPHCRRKLFFEWIENYQSNHLIPFAYFPQYLHLLEGNQGLQEHAKRDLIKGLNRAFSKVFISDSDNLHVTSQYARTIEQPMPIVQLSLPADNIELVLLNNNEQAYDYSKNDLMLKISPPPQMEDRNAIRWPINLLRFEYLMRLAQGGTYNILSEECDLVVRQLKDEILTRFATHMQRKGYVQFIVGEHSRYILKKLWIDEEGKKIQVGM